MPISAGFREANLCAISAAGASAMIPFKTNSSATRPGVWNYEHLFFNCTAKSF
jgi:hypothetical protein